MTSYLCLVTTRPGHVPQLRHLDCENDHQIEAALPRVMSEWSSIHQVEILDGDRSVRILKGEDLAAVLGRQMTE